MKESTRNSKWWFWVSLLQITVPKGKRFAAIRGEVWENLVIINAATPNAAYVKAIRLGKKAEGDCHGTLKLDGRPAFTKFLGLSGMGLIHEELADGSEICFRQWRSTLKKASSSVEKKENIIACLKKEMAPYKCLLNSGNKA